MCVCGCAKAFVSEPKALLPYVSIWLCSARMRISTTEQAPLFREVCWKAQDGDVTDLNEASLLDADVLPLSTKLVVT